jgi:hypothetical protein
MDAPDDDEEQEWLNFAAVEFLKGYAPSDAIYDEMPPDSAQDVKAEGHEGEPGS